MLGSYSYHNNNTNRYRFVSPAGVTYHFHISPTGPATASSINHLTKPRSWNERTSPNRIAVLVCLDCLGVKKHHYNEFKWRRSCSRTYFGYFLNSPRSGKRDRIRAEYEPGGFFYPGKISCRHKSGTYDIDFDDSDTRKNVPHSQIRPRKEKSPKNNTVNLGISGGHFMTEYLDSMVVPPFLASYCNLFLKCKKN